jgi:hypothetical protein
VMSSRTGEESGNVSMAKPAMNTAQSAALAHQTYDDYTGFPQYQYQYQYQYPTPIPSPFWPYESSLMQYNGFNFFTPSFPSSEYWYSLPPQSNLPSLKPSRSGTIRIDPFPPPLPQTPTPHPQSMPHIPQPTQDYILTASIPPYRLETPTKKLLILDLNGTLLFRPRHVGKDRNIDMRQSSTNPILRPHLTEFINYIFRHFKIMFWSSATPRNVKSMIAASTTLEQRNNIIATWGRDTLGLSAEEYIQKSITIKDLRKVFQDEQVAKEAENGGGWDVSNTILLDDSVVKASYQPYNHVCVPEFLVDPAEWTENGGIGKSQDDALWQVAGYLEELRYQGHVARFIKQNPFRVGDGWNGMCLDLQ